MITTRKKTETPNAVTIAALEEVDAGGGELLQGAALLDEAIKDPTIDVYLDRSPKLNTEVDYEQMVRILRNKRVAFISAEQKRKEPKVEGEIDVEA